MPASPFDSALYGGLMGDAEIGRLLTDSAEVRAMLIVEGALARVQGELGLIPAVSARAIHRASLEAAIDPAGLAAETGRSGVPVPALVAAFRAQMQAPEHAAYVHWGATSQDIVDTALALRLRQVLAIARSRLRALLAALAELAEAHAGLPMAGRTWGQAATPTSFGAVVAAWGRPLLRHLERLDALEPRLLVVSLAGAAGTLSAMGPRGPEVRAALAEALGLADPGAGWHDGRDTIAELGGWLAGLTGSLGKIGEDLALMAQSEIGEVRLPAGGGSSTMPQKSNPVKPALLSALAAHAAAQAATLYGALRHRQQRDGAAWFAEWLALPQMLVAGGRALFVAGELAEGLAPVPGRLAAPLREGLGLAFAEALSFRLSAEMPRPEAQAAAKALCAEAVETGTPLAELAARAHPGIDWRAVFDPEAQLGTAPDEARAFAAAVRAL